MIWDNCTQYEKLELDKIQNEAARIVTVQLNKFPSMLFFTKFSGIHLLNGGEIIN